MRAAGEAPIWRLLHAGKPGAELATALRRQEAWLPCFLTLADNIPAGPLPYHSGSVLAHTARCMDAVAGDALAVWMALCHDAGKLTTPAAMLPHHYGHEVRGEKLAAVWARQLALPENYLRAGVLSARLHMKAGRYARLRPGKKFDLLQELSASGFFAPFWKLAAADSRSAIDEKAWRDWRRICKIPLDRKGDERLRQQGISLLKADN